MSLRLSERPERDRPRERLWSVGPAALTGQELLAILLGTGCAGRDALAVAGELLARVDGSLRRLAGRPSADLARVPGVGRGKAARVVAALELGRRGGAAPGAGPRSGGRAAGLRLPVAGSRGGGISRAGPRQPESGTGRSPHHAGDLEQLARPPAGGVSRRDRPVPDSGCRGPAREIP